MRNWDSYHGPRAKEANVFAIENENNFFENSVIFIAGITGMS